MRALRISLGIIILSSFTGCSILPSFLKPGAKSADAAATSPDNPEAAEAALVLEAERQEALRALPDRTVVLEEKPPGLLKRWREKIFPPRKPEAPAAVAPVWIGTIKLVNAADKYVMIDSQLSAAVSPGVVLNSVGNDFESGSVRTTNDRVHSFFIADIVSGNPAVGDRVYSPR